MYDLKQQQIYRGVPRVGSHKCFPCDVIQPGLTTILNCSSFPTYSLQYTVDLKIFKTDFSTITLTFCQILSVIEFSWKETFRYRLRCYLKFCSNQTCQNQERWVKSESCIPLNKMSNMLKIQIFVIFRVSGEDPNGTHKGSFSGDLADQHLRLPTGHKIFHFRTLFMIS